MLHKSGHLCPRREEQKQMWIKLIMLVVYRADSWADVKEESVASLIALQGVHVII